VLTAPNTAACPNATTVVVVVVVVTVVSMLFLFGWLYK